MLRLWGIKGKQEKAVGMDGQEQDCCDELVIEVVCSMAFEPVIVTDGMKVVACNQGAAELFGYASKEDFIGLGVREMIDLHFEPTLVVEEDGGVRRALEEDVTFARAKSDDSVKQTAVVSAKQWHVGSRGYYTIAVRSISVVRIANERRMLQPNTALLNFATTERYQQCQLSVLSQMTDALPGMVWVVSRVGEVLYINRQVMQVFGVATVDEPWVVTRCWVC